MSKIWFLLLLIIIPLMSDIDELIESMQLVSDEERFKLMNQFKEEVIQMQEKERIEAMMKVISITDSNHSHKILKEANKRHEVDDINDNIDYVIETSDMTNIENISNSNEVDEIETDEVEDDD